MTAPWTRDSTVRTYVVTMAPEVAGRIVELRVADNQFVHKGDLLLVIDPTNFKIALQLADAAVDQAQATAQNAQREAERRRKLDDLSVSVEQKQEFNAKAVAAQAQYQQAVANRDQAKVNLERTQIRSPVNGWVTNLLAQLGAMPPSDRTRSRSSTPIPSGSMHILRKRNLPPCRRAILPRSN
jgi:RND family efflux transporter MFP subunit